MSDLVRVATKNERYKQHFLISDFTPYRGVSKDFVEWWTQYYQRFHVDIEVCRNRITETLIPVQG